ncbi:hypothetical protein ACLG6S_17705 [Thermodesulfobacteriota bacterium B35]
MASTTITCPHCGAETEDPEYCRVCGELIEEFPGEEKLPGGDKIEQFTIKEEVFFGEVFARLFSSFKPCVGKKLWDDRESPFYIDIDDDPAYFDLPGGSMYFHYHDDDDE